MEALFKLVHDLPKVELHAHIGGSIRPQTFVELCNDKNISIEHIDFYKLNVETAFQIFKVTDQLVTEPRILARVTREVVEDYSKHNCRYLELRSTPKIVGEITDKELYIETVLDSIVQAEQDFKSIQVNFLVSISRTAPVEVAAEVIDLVIKLRKQDDPKYQKLVGLEMSGDPRKGNFADFKE